MSQPDCLTRTGDERSLQPLLTKGPAHGHYFDRYRSPRTHHNDRCRIPSLSVPPVAGLCGSTATRAVLGSTDLAGNIHRHDVRPGGRSEYHMTGPDGEKAGGFWEFLSVDAPRSFEVRDGFADDNGTPNTELPGMRMIFEFTETDSGSKLTTTTYFPSAEALEQLLEMGMLEGTREAMGQIDAVVTDDPAFDPGQPAQLHYLDDVTVRVSRVLGGTPEQVWQAHHEPKNIRRWMLGPDGWHMPVCEVGVEILESAAPHREVATETMIGVDGPGTVNAMNLIELADGTLLTVVITYPSQELRDTVVATGMVDGMELSYARLEAKILTTYP